MMQWKAYFRNLTLGFLLILAVNPPSVWAESRFGATVAIPDIPHGITGEFDFMPNPSWSFGLNAGGLSLNFPSSKVQSFSISAYNLRARWHPFQGSFFLGTAGGIQSFSAAGSDTFSVDAGGGETVNLAGTAKMTLNSPYVTPHLGWYWVFGADGKGFTLGLEAGVQLPLNTDSTLDLTLDDPAQNQLLTLVEQTAEYQELRTKIQDAASKLGNHWLPYVAMRFGWTF